MSSVQQLITDLSSLSTESKRRNNDVKTACDRALSLLKPYQDSQQPKKSIGDKDFLSSHLDREDLAKPFIISLLNSNVKFATISIPVLHRLINFHLIPETKIPELLTSLGEASNLAIDIQLRTLQCLPSVMQTYKKQMRGELLLKLLSICSNLTTSNKPTVVINTASATLQQLFTFIYDDYNNKEEVLNTDECKTVTVDEGKTVLLDQKSYEGFKIFEDLCKLASQEKPQYLPGNMYIDGLSVLELIENIIASHRHLFVTRIELGFLLRQKVIPKLLRSLNEAAIERNKDSSSYAPSSFPVVVRVMRIIQVLLHLELLDVVEVESEVILSYLNLILSESLESTHDYNGTGSGTDGGIGHVAIDDYWEYLVLEVYRNLFHDFKVVKCIFEKFDERKDSKNIFQELLSTLNDFLQRGTRSQQTDILTPIDNITSTGTSPSIVSRHSNMRISILDHLDKSVPPMNNIPQTYSTYLIHQIMMIISEGIAKFVNNLSNVKSSKTLENDVEFVSTLIERSYPDLSQLFDKSLYTAMDNESFHGLIRSIQKFTHTTGLLGLGSLRDGFLIMISKSIIKNVEKIPIEEENGTNSGGDEESTISAIAESLGIQERTIDNTSQSLRPRKFNSRHLTCFRALVNLAVSLGSTLDKSWNIIWITFQWCEYFVNGPTDFKRGGKISKRTPEELNPKLSANDFANLESSKKKFYDSLIDYPVDSFHNVIQSLTYLGTTKDIFIDSLTICPHNRTYFMDQIVDLSLINPIKFLIENEKTWVLTTKYFIDNVIIRSMHYNLRIHNVQMFNKVIQNVTQEGFKDENEAVNANTANKSLAGFMNLLDKISELGKPQELLVVNCETEIHLLVLTTLHQLIDTYDKYYQNSWEIVFSILNTPFKSTENEESEKLKLLLACSFDTLKLILDEFIFSLPFDQVRILIDTLFEFCKQRGDLNILFSAVSYFWLIGDSIKKKVDPKDSQDLISIKYEDGLVGSIEKGSNYTMLDIYLLLTLSKITSDTRAQVRDGAIQTFFQIIDVHGSLFDAQYWKLVYELVIPNFLNLELNIQDQTFNKKEWIESLKLILSGLVSLYSSFLLDLDSSTTYWSGLIDYFKTLLSMKWVDLNVLIFESFNDCLRPFQNDDIKDENISDLLFKFWTEVPIEYDFLNPLFQESLTKHMKCFPRLYKIIKNKSSLEDTQQILNTFNACARYPVLQETYLDDKKPSKLQQAVYENFEIFELNKSNAINSAIIQLLSNIIVFPFATRARIEKKIGGSNFHGKTPTFIAISSISLRLLSEKIDQLQSFEVLIEDKGILKLMKSLLEIVNNKFKGVPKIDGAPLWIEANEAIRKIIMKVICPYSSSSSSTMSVELWRLILTAVKLSFHTEELEYESINISHYFALIDVVLPKLTNSSSPNQELIQDFIEEIYDCSFLYSSNELESSLKESSESIVDFSEKLSNFNFNELFGTTEPLVISKSKRTSIMCLRELIKFSSIDSTSASTTLTGKSLEYFICRLAFSLRRFVADEHLLLRAPLPQVQQEELLEIVEGILKVQEGLHSEAENKKIKQLYPLLIASIPYASRIIGLSLLLEKVFISLSK